MASLETILKAIREDIIVNRVMACTGAMLDERFEPHGDPQDWDDAGTLREQEGPTRRFDVIFLGHEETAMCGSSIQDYYTQWQIEVYYPKTQRGAVAMGIDAADIWQQLNANDSLPTGVELYDPENVFEKEELEDYDILVIPVTVRVSADL